MISSSPIKKKNSTRYILKKYKKKIKKDLSIKRQRLNIFSTKMKINTNYIHGNEFRRKNMAMSIRWKKNIQNYNQEREIRKNHI